MPRKPGRPKAGETTLTRADILNAALRLIDAHGVDALTMRRLAAALGVDPMTLYRHLPDKAALLTCVVEMVFTGFHVPCVPGADWREQVRAFAHAYHRLVTAHPHLIIYLITHADAAAPAALAAGETLYAALTHAGLTPRQTVHAADLIVDYLNGFALAASSGRLDQPGQYADLYARLDALPSTAYPVQRAVFGALAAVGLAADYATMPLAGLEIILDGISAQVRSTA